MENKTYISKVEVSVRRVGKQGLPGDDVTLHNQKVGASLKGNGPLKGLEYEEEVKYLPEIVGVSPKDNEWRQVIRDYWSNISVKIPADGETAGKYDGKLINFTIVFDNQQDKDNFDKVISQEEKAELSKKGTVVEGVHDFVFWRYCLVYGRVANRFEDIKKSPKIMFYIYSKESQLKVEHNAFKQRVAATDLFTKMLMDEGAINAVLLMFEMDLSVFDSLADKHLALEALLNKRPQDFVKFAGDVNLQIKAAIKTATEKGIIKNPSNTDSYYYGENNEVVLGHSLEDAVIYWKTEKEENKNIVTAIKARLKQI